MPTIDAPPTILSDDTPPSAAPARAATDDPWASHVSYWAAEIRAIDAKVDAGNELDPKEQQRYRDLHKLHARHSKEPLPPFLSRERFPSLAGPPMDLAQEIEDLNRARVLPPDEAAAIRAEMDAIGSRIDSDPSYWHDWKAQLRYQELGAALHPPAPMNDEQLTRFMEAFELKRKPAT